MTIDAGDGQQLRVKPIDPPTCSAGFDRVGDVLRNRSQLSMPHFGNAACLYFKATDALCAAGDLLEHTPEALLCDAASCTVCQAARKTIAR